MLITLRATLHTEQVFPLRIHMKMKGSEQLFQNWPGDAWNVPGGMNHQQPLLTADPGDKECHAQRK
jgi:hypothetical protein